MKLKCCLHMHRKGVPEKYRKHWAMSSNTMESCKDCNLENMVYPDDDLDQMRNQMYEMEPKLRKIGLPERTGFSCWNLKLFKISWKEYPKGRKLLGEAVDLNIRFHMKYDEFEGEMEDWVPSKTDRCALRLAKMMKFLRGKTCKK